MAKTIRIDNTEEVCTYMMTDFNNRKATNLALSGDAYNILPASCDSCLDNGCMIITKALPLPGGGYELCALSTNGSHNWNLYVGGILTATVTNKDSPCFTVAFGFSFELQYTGVVSMCSRIFVIADEYECPEDLVKFDFEPGCDPIEVTINVDEDALECTPFVITYDDSGHDPELTGESIITKSFLNGIFEICITQCVGALRFDQIVTCCYTLDLPIVCCPDADFTFFQNPTIASAPSKAVGAIPLLVQCHRSRPIPMIYVSIPIHPPA